ncbi:hypothetical protein JAO73_21710 [Hymenobacter sp. BT523]|uniref:hypothetical protein n=1 Tax=Hymenobacter sp. BT523 TaxID=2795725 RepID=UPI0018EB6283|nr:hypothetical protein [Hymenobacter sp. BT523]MBJ6111653.1 hypothetical protein [Hymenobacter sp. BT523]
MHFILPRRHRRQLLFPPGLLALAGLLWLGCVMLGAHRAQLTLHTVLQLTMPPVSNSDFLWGTMPGMGPRMRYSELPRFRTWHTVEFGRGGALDSLAAREAESAIRELARVWEAVPAHDGLRVRFGPNARYASMIWVLDLMNRYNVKKYFFDLYHPRTETTFYAFNGPLRRQQWSDPLLGPTPAPEMPREAPTAQPADLPLAPAFWVRILNTENWALHASQFNEPWELLGTPEWEAPLLLLALMATLALWRAAWQWRP